MLLGDVVKKLLHPFVKGTKLEHCGGCEKRRQWLNNANQGVVNLIAKLTCPCFWRGLFK